MWKWMMKICETEFDSLALASKYLDATAGQFLSGLIHSANNSCHIIALAAELLRGEISQNPSTKLDRILSAESDLQAIFNTATSRSQLLVCTPEEVLVDEIIRTELEFFHNCLFFKHYIQPVVTTAPGLGILRLPPLPLVYCLEAGLLNVVEACQTEEPTGPIKLEIDITTASEETCIAMTSSTHLPADIDPFAPGTSTRPGHVGMGLTIARELCTRLGWSVTRNGDAASCTYTLTIPGRESDFASQ